MKLKRFWKNQKRTNAMKKIFFKIVDFIFCFMVVYVPVVLVFLHWLYFGY